MYHSNISTTTICRRSYTNYNTKDRAGRSVGRHHQRRSRHLAQSKEEYRRHHQMFKTFTPIPFPYDNKDTNNNRYTCKKLHAYTEDNANNNTGNSNNGGNLTPPSCSGVNLTINPWTIQLDDTYLSTRIISRTCRDVEKTVLILFLDKDACVDYRRIMMENYEASGGIWTTNCVSYSMYAKKGMIVLESTPQKQFDTDMNIFENITKLRCIELDMNDELKMYDLNLVTNVIYFITTSFENDANNQIITLHGVFSQTNENETSASFSYGRDSDNTSNHVKNHYLIDYMNRIYNNK